MKGTAPGAVAKVDAARSAARSSLETLTTAADGTFASGPLPDDAAYAVAIAKPGHTFKAAAAGKKGAAAAALEFHFESAALSRVDVEVSLPPQDLVEGPTL